MPPSLQIPKKPVGRADKAFNPEVVVVSFSDGEIIDYLAQFREDGAGVPPTLDEDPELVVQY